MTPSANDPAAGEAPYHPPQEVAQPKGSYQTKLLQELIDYRQSPSTRSMLMRNWRRFAVVLGYGILVAFLPWIVGLHPSTLYLSVSFAFGFWLTATAMMLGQCRARKRAWPTLDKIIDWDRVDEMLD